MIASRTVTLAELLQAGRFEPARIQREYQWTTTEVDRLLDDLVAQFQRIGNDPETDEDTDIVADDVVESDSGTQSAEHDDWNNGEPPPVKPIKEPVRQMPDAYFLGNVVMLLPRGSKTFIVYDGLQRLVTINILISKLRDSWPEMNDATRSEITGLLAQQTENESIRRLSYPTSGRTLASIVEQTAWHNRELTAGDFRMRQAALRLERRFDQSWSTDRRVAFLKFMSNDVLLTLTQTNNQSVAYQMFIGANNRGVRLEIGDVLKGTIADQVRRNGGTVEQVEAVAKGWRDGQIKLRSSFDSFIHAVEVVKYRTYMNSEKARDKFGKAHATGEKLQFLFDEWSSPGGIVEWINGEFASLVDRFARSQQHFSLSHIEGIDLSFRQLAFLSWTEWQPLYLTIALKHKSLNSQSFAAEIRDLQRACYVVELLDWQESTRRKKFCEAIAQREKNVSPFKSNPGAWRGCLHFDREADGAKAARRALRAPLITAEKRRSIVKLIETLHWGRRVPRASINDTSVEHVLPVSAMIDWQRLFTDQEREDLTNRIGNLCLIDKGTNERLGNASWYAKKREYEMLRTTSKSVDLVLRTSSELEAAGEDRPWCALAVNQLTEQLASIAEKGLGLT